MYIMLNVLYYILVLEGNQIFLYTRIIQILGALLFFNELRCLIYFKQYISAENIFINLMILFLGALFVGFFHGQFLNVLILVNFLGFYGFGLFFSRRVSELKYLKYIFFSVSLLFIYYFLTGKPPTYWSTHSQNHVSILILALLCFYYLGNYSKKPNSIYILPSLLALLVSILALGRSGIITSSVIILGIVVLNLFRKSYYDFTKLVPIIFLFVILTLANNSDYKYIIFNRFYSENIISEGRDFVISYWLQEMSHLKSFFFGVDLSYLKNSYNLSSHNSYISTHSKFGIFSLLLIIQYVLTIKKLLITNHFLLLLLIAVSIRSITDNILFANTFLFGAIFYSIYFMSLRIHSREIFDRKTIGPMNSYYH